MKKYALIFILTVCLSGCQDRNKQASEKFQNQKKMTTYYLIRHGEKQDGDDPALTEKGKARAAMWAEHFKNDSIDAVYSTNTKRTLATAAPTAEEFGLEVQKYEPSKLYSESFKKNTAGKHVLIVGHTNTTPDLANAILGRKEYTEDIPMNQFGRLYIIEIKDGKAEGKIKTLNNLGNGLH